MAKKSTHNEHKDTSTRVEETTGEQPIKPVKPKKEGGITGKGFKPGQSGNPAGRPPGSLSLLGLLKKRLAEINPENGRTYAEQFMDNIIQDAMDLDGPSRKLVMQYIEGMPKQQMIIDTNKDSVGELTEFFRNVAKGESIQGPQVPPTLEPVLPAVPMPTDIPPDTSPLNTEVKS